LVLRVDPVIIQAINEASGEVDKYLGKRFALPLALCGANGCPPPLLRRLTSVIAMWLLYRRVKPDEVQKEYEWAIQNLTAIAKGELVLACADGTPAGAPAGGNSPLYSFDCARFDCDGIAGFRFAQPNQAGCGCSGPQSGCGCADCCKVTS
jgi:phage gp36-like protein